jgi:soluble lytic murein transglycosylase-like protein
MKKTTIATSLSLLLSPALAESPLQMIKRINDNNYQLPYVLAYGVAKVESGFKCHVTGGVGEVGMYQMKYATAKGVGYNGTRNGLYDCGVNAHYGLKHLSIAYNKCGTIAGAAKLHNAGLGASCKPSQYSYKVISAGNSVMNGGEFIISKSVKRQKTNKVNNSVSKSNRQLVDEYFANQSKTRNEAVN